LVAGTVCAGQVGFRSAWMRFQAVMIAVAQGHVAAISSHEKVRVAISLNRLNRTKDAVTRQGQDA
jgi:hypothetical protein